MEKNPGAEKRSVAGIAVKGNKLFIVRRGAGGDLGGKWEFPGGKAEEGESDEAALEREYREELGVRAGVGPLLASSFFAHNGMNFSLNAYRVSFDEKDVRLSEHTEWRWAGLEDIRNLDFADSDRKLLDPLEAELEKQARVQQGKAGARLA
ncbi:MAG: NUDIX domain-containing protein [Treponema sp.]|nr:NUDIX domain-containing protein [Treponema sp.]